MNKVLISLALLMIVTSCGEDQTDTSDFTTTSVTLSTHKLSGYSIINNSTYLVVFETGLGNDHTIWNKKKLPETISATQDVLLYDRAGYGKSGKAPSPRNLSALSAELENVITHFSNGRKVVLVGHSLGGLIIRDYAIRNPNNIAGLLFIDPTHEAYNNPTQEQEDLLYNTFLNSSGADFGGTREARELIEDLSYSSSLGSLPNVPTIVLTSMKHDAGNDYSDETYHKTREDWFNAHELLKTGVTDFTHVSTEKAGHYIFIEEPNLVLENLNVLLSKLP